MSLKGKIISLKNPQLATQTSFPRNVYTRRGKKTHSHTKEMEATFFLSSNIASYWEGEMVEEEEE